jgi:carboxypeptidase family protein
MRSSRASRSRTSRLLAMALFLALPACAAHLGGRVTFQQKPVPDAVVRVYQVDASSKTRGMVVATRTGADGFYQFRDLPHGQYIVIVEKYGKRLFQGKAFVQTDVVKNIDLT